MFKDEKSMARYQRESSNRHQSERLLDNNIYKFHKQMLNDKVKKLNMLDPQMKDKIKAQHEAEAKEKELLDLKSKSNSKGKSSVYCSQEA